MERLEGLIKQRLAATSRGSEVPSSPGAEPAPACPVCGDTGWVGVDAPVGHPDFGRAFPCQCRQEGEGQGHLGRLQRYSNLGPLTRLTFDGLIPTGVRPDAPSQQLFGQALEAALAFARQPRGWLVLLGPSGTGKTHLAAAMANELLGRGERVFFVVVPDLLDHLRAAFSPESPVAYDDLFEQVGEAPVLVLDDLGAQSATPWAQEKLFQVFNHRFNRELPTVVTTNVSLDRLDEAVRSRLRDTALSQVCRTAEESFLGAMDLPRLRAMTFRSFDTRRPEIPSEERDSLQHACRAAQAYAQAPEGWLVLIGESGTGKTHLAAAVANELLGHGQFVLFIVVSDLLDHLRATFHPESTVRYDELFEQVKTAPVLVLDGLGASSTTTPWAREKLFQIVNYRYNAGLPLVVTTTLDLGDRELDPRLGSRLGDVHISHPIQLKLRPYNEGKPAPRIEGPRGDGGRRRRQPA